MPLQSTRNQFIGFIVWLAVSFTASAVGAFATIHAQSFYQELTQPPWAPPAWLFGPVWTTLYALMAVAAWLVWRTGKFRDNRIALTLFLVQLTFNALWSWLFFAWLLGALAFANIVFLWGLLAATIFTFWRVRPVAGALLVPYLLWVTFAATLNYSVWQLNPQILGS